MSVLKQFYYREYPVLKKWPVVTQNGTESAFHLCMFDMQEIHLNSGFHMVENQDKIPNVWPILALWGLENNYLRCKIKK